MGLQTKPGTRHYRCDDCGATITRHQWMDDGQCDGCNPFPGPTSVRDRCAANSAAAKAKRQADMAERLSYVVPFTNDEIQGFVLSGKALL